MTAHREVTVFALLCMVVGSAFAIDEEPDYRLMNSIAACRTTQCVTERHKLVHSKLERTVLFTKWMMLDSSNRTAAKGLLENIPTTEEELAALFTLPDWHDGATTSQTDMQRLDLIYESWPRLLSVAVRRLPEYLPAYIRYGRLAVNDMHSEYTGYERAVCRADRRRFWEAFQTLSADDQKYIRMYVFNPDTCTPIFISEAE